MTIFLGQRLGDDFGHVVRQALGVADAFERGARLLPAPGACQRSTWRTMRSPERNNPWSSIGNIHVLGMGRIKTCMATGRQAFFKHRVQMNLCLTLAVGRRTVRTVTI